MKTVLFTFDYELFLGARSGKAKDCIIDPTARLLTLFQQYGFKGVFFIDTVYLIRLQEVAEQHTEAARDLTAIKEQLALLLLHGHEIFPHIHAHWLDAVYLPAQNEWSLKNIRYYQFSGLPEQQQQTLFDRSLEILYSIAGPAKDNYTADAYRAGGWCIQPFSHFRPCFIKYGIKHEWSVMPGKYQISDAHSFDFRGAPIQDAVYRFNDDPCQKDVNGPFTEWTISSLTLNSWEKWLDFKMSGLLKRMGKGLILKGEGVSSNITEEGDSHCAGNQKRIKASFEGLSPFTLKKYVLAIRRTEYFHFISHPKLITPFEFKMIEKLFKTLKGKYEIQTDFRNILI